MRRRGLVVLALALPAIAHVTLSARANPAPGVDKWAVVVGVQRYNPPTHPTVGAVGDATDFQRMLLNAGWPSDHILTLTDAAATGQAIRDSFRWLHDHSSTNSYSVFHYSGHVKQKSGDLDRDGEDVDEFLWGVDNQLIPDGELASWMKSLGGYVWVDIAGCEAAGFDDGISAPNRLFTGSSQETEKSYEDPEWDNSVYTGLLADQGVNSGYADYNGDGVISVTEAFQYADDNAPEITARQSKGPQHPYANGGDGSQWYLNFPTPPAPPPPPPPPESPPAQQCTRVLGVVCLPLPI